MSVATEASASGQPRNSVWLALDQIHGANRTATFNSLGSGGSADSIDADSPSLGPYVGDPLR